MWHLWTKINSSKNPEDLSQETWNKLKKIAKELDLFSQEIADEDLEIEEGTKCKRKRVEAINSRAIKILLDGMTFRQFAQMAKKYCDAYYLLHDIIIILYAENYENEGPEITLRRFCDNANIVLIDGSWISTDRLYKGYYEACKTLGIKPEEAYDFCSIYFGDMEDEALQKKASGWKYKQ